MYQTFGLGVNAVFNYFNEANFYIYRAYCVVELSIQTMQQPNRTNSSIKF